MMVPQPMLFWPFFLMRVTSDVALQVVPIHLAYASLAPPFCWAAGCDQPFLMDPRTKPLEHDVLTNTNGTFMGFIADL